MAVFSHGDKSEELAKTLGSKNYDAYVATAVVEVVSAVYLIEPGAGNLQEFLEAWRKFNTIVYRKRLIAHIVQLEMIRADLC